MKLKENYFSKVLILFTVLFFILQGCSDNAMESTWQSEVIVIDGSKNEWEGSLKYFEDEKVAIGISNDDDFVYFCLATSDNSKIMKILLTGFTIWLDPLSSDGETIGFQYPIKRKMTGIMDRSQHGTKGGQNSDKKLKQMIEKFKVEQNEILIVNHDNFPLNAYPLENKTGLEAKINYEMHQMVYELKVPLANNKFSNVYIDALPNELLKVGFESGEFDGPEGKERGGMNNAGAPGKSGGMSRSGMAGGGRGGNRGGSKANMASRQELKSPIEFWMDVKLAGK